VPARQWTKVLLGLGVPGLVIASFLVGLGVGRTGAPPAAGGFDLVREAEARVLGSSARHVEEKTLAQGAIRGMLTALGDPYAEYLDREGYRSFQDATAGHFSGVGLWLKVEDGKVRVVSVLDDTPASKAGIEADDLISSIDGRSVKGMSLDRVVQVIKGTPGSTVRIEVLRGRERITFPLMRTSIDLPTLQARLTDDHVGVIELLTFSSGVGDRVHAAVDKLVKRGAKAFILDLRGNPGGLLDEAVGVAGAFLDGGTVVSYRPPSSGEVVYSARSPAATALPLVILVDEGSASASEVVAGAIKDRGRGILVGTRTYGKGSIQTVLPLSDGSALKLTTSYYHTPSGRSIGEGGIEPDVTVEAKSGQLAEARQILSEMLAEVPAKRAG
jgi:carboxyl-terminal processing protease